MSIYTIYRDCKYIFGVHNEKESKINALLDIPAKYLKLKKHQDIEKTRLNVNKQRNTID